MERVRNLYCLPFHEGLLLVSYVTFNLLNGMPATKNGSQFCSQLDLVFGTGYTFC